MKLQRRHVLITGAAVAAAGAGAWMSWRRIAPRPVLSEAEAAFWAGSFEGPNGEAVNLAAMRGRPLLVNFWATWCPPCRREMPSMERLSQRLKDQPFVILAINQQENPEDVFVFTGQLDPAPTFPILFDRNSKIANAWGVQGLPASFIVDKQGRVVYRAMGGREFDHPEIEKAIRRLLKNEQLKK